LKTFFSDDENEQGLQQFPGCNDRKRLADENPSLFLFIPFSNPSRMDENQSFRNKVEDGLKVYLPSSYTQSGLCKPRQACTSMLTRTKELYIMRKKCVGIKR